MFPPQEHSRHLITGLGSVQVPFGYEEVYVVLALIRNQVVKRAVEFDRPGNGMGRPLNDAHHFTTDLLAVA